MNLFELGRNRVERVAAAAHHAIELLLAAIEQILRLENQTPPTPPHAVKLIFGVRADPFARLFARLRREQNRQAHAQPEAQQQSPTAFPLSDTLPLLRTSISVPWPDGEDSSFKSSCS